MTKALVLGANGQDGSYLCEILCARGYDVVGAGRQLTPRWPVAMENYRYRNCDIARHDALTALLGNASPDLIFHFAAVHGAAGFAYEAVWPQAHQVNTVSAHAVLDYIRADKPDCAFVYASSSKVFGDVLPAHVNETSPRLSADIYSITKNAAHALIDYYRRRHGVKASVLYMFNHESPRRAPQYFVPRIAQALHKAKTSGAMSEIYTLDFFCDWGDAREYMEIVADIAERALGDDYILATGTTWTGRQMVKQLFARHGLDHTAHLTEMAAPLAAANAYQASNAKLKAALGRVPIRSILDVFDEFLRAAP